tara:strand:+ start:51 stop:692 length:642 start_codon:yes stop_codon:yes gene_type:complete
MNNKEVSHLVIVIILFAFIISFLQGISVFAWALLIAFITLGVNIIAKEFTASYLDAEIKNKIWHLQRRGWYDRSKFKKPIPTGVIIPFLLSILSWGSIACLTFLQTDIKATSARTAKRRGGATRFAEMTEWHIGAIPAMGIVANLIIAILLYTFFRNIPLILDIVKFNIYYAIWNLLPIGQLDGTKIFFGSRYLWLFLAAISTVFTLTAIFLI